MNDPFVKNAIEYYISSNEGYRFNNTYLELYIFRGEVACIAPRQWTIGYLTCGLSSYFTKPMVVIIGENNSENMRMAKYIEKVCEDQKLLVDINLW
jgi:hypothetical protein